MTNHVVIVAAGKGRRFGGIKQFFRIHGRPLLVYSALTLENHQKIDAMTLVVPQREIKRTRKIVKEFKLEKVRHIVAGGRRRQDSVLKGLETITGRNGVVIIHDAVRPIVSNAMIGRGISLCRKYKSVILGVRVHDTVKRVSHRLVRETIPRRDLFLVQTPQFYDLQTIKKAIALADFRVEYTDEAAMLESIGWPVYLFQGDRYNIKVTDKNDLKFVRKLLA